MYGVGGGNSKVGGGKLQGCRHLSRRGCWRTVYEVTFRVRQLILFWRQQSQGGVLFEAVIVSVFGQRL